jgi:hypothetical protein
MSKGVVVVPSSFVVDDPLRLRGERRGEQVAGDHRDDGSPLHQWLSSSAHPKSNCEMVNLITGAARHPSKTSLPLTATVDCPARRVNRAPRLKSSAIEERDEA